MGKDENENELKFMKKRNEKKNLHGRWKKKKNMLNEFCCESRDPEAVHKVREKRMIHKQVNFSAHVFLHDSQSIFFLWTYECNLSARPFDYKFSVTAKKNSWKTCRFFYFGGSLVKQDWKVSERIWLLQMMSLQVFLMKSFTIDFETF